MCIHEKLIQYGFSECLDARQYKIAALDDGRRDCIEIEMPFLSKLIENIA